MAKIVAIITDFGVEDPYVGIMKGVILSLDPEIQIVDVNNGITPYDIREGAFNLMVSYSYFPKGTVFLVVVDPGVGGERKAIIVKSLERLFVGPDNGVLTPVITEDAEIYELEIPKWASRTFHGRDVFAPAAARLASGVHPARIGKPISKVVKLRWPEPKIEKNLIYGEILLVDRFGNLITNVKSEYIKGHSVRVEIGRRIIEGLKSHYSEVNKGELLLIIGSAGFLEISAREDNASRILGVGAETPVKILLD